MPKIVWQGVPQCGSSMRERTIYIYVLRLHSGTIRGFFSYRILKSVLLGMYSFSSSFRYRGPRPFSTLKTKSILKSIRADTGSQCKLQNKYRCNVFISASGC